jgi:parvulin-like peptidyl-prolyl isomerase
MRTPLVLAVLLAVSCQQGKSKLDSVTAQAPAGSATTTAKPSSVPPGGDQIAPVTPPEPVEDIDSKDILARTETAPSVYVKHVLLGWKGVGHDPRANQRTNAQAAALAREIQGKLKADPSQIDALVKQYSEDPGSLKGEPYNVEAKTPFVPEFKNLSLRLKEKEVGIVKTRFGYHVIERVSPPAPDPLESTAVLARPAEQGTVYINHLVVGFKEAMQPPAGVTRSKADADKLAKDIVDKANSGESFDKLIEASSDEPDSKGKKKQMPIEISGDTQIIKELKELALRLKVGEAGMTKTPFGWLVLKRVAPPPPDPLESADILKRPVAAQKASVKHILLGWTEVHAEDPRGKKRTRAELEKLVKDTVARLNKGEKIEPLMKELSEDPGSANSGQSYDVTPEASLVPPFKNLSLRLKVGEVGVVRSEFGIHIIQRVS